MEIKKIFVDGYRNIEKNTIEISDITSILSINNYGKSNLLFSIVFGLSFLQQHPKNKQVMMNDVRCIPFLKKKSSACFTFEIECQSNWNEKDLFLKYRYSFAWGKGPNLGQIVFESLQMSDNGKDFTTFIKRDNDCTLYKSSRTGRCVTEIQIGNSELVINKLLAFDNLYYRDILREFLNVNVYIDRHFETESGYGITFMSEQELTDLTLKPEANIPKTLFRIKQDYPNKYELLCNAYKNLFPSVKDLVVQEVTAIMPNNVMPRNINGFQNFSDKVYVLFVDDKNLKASINFGAMSDGARRILLLLTFIVVAQINKYNLICIEEPENSINPGLLRSFLYTIKELAEDTKILYSSHSPYLINYMEPDNLYLGIPSDDGVAIFKKIKPSTNNIKRLVRVLQDNDLALGDYLFDLMSGTSEDYKELLSYVE